MTLTFQKIISRFQYATVAVAVVVALSAIVLLNGGHTASWLGYWWLFPIAFVIALAVNTTGISGSSLFVPFFVLVFPLLSGMHLAPLETVKIGLMTESFGLSSSALAFVAFGLVDFKVVRASILSALPFLVAGILIVSIVPGSILYLMAAGLLIAAVVLLQIERVLEAKNPTPAEAPEGDGAWRGARIVSSDGKTYRYAYTRGGFIRRLLGYAVGGVFQGATGFGIGEMGIVALLASRMPVRVAIGTNHLIVASTAVVASVAHFSLAAHGASSGAPFPWQIPLMTIPAVALAGQLAPHLAAKLPTRALERFVSALFILAAGALVLLVLRQ